MWPRGPLLALLVIVPGVAAWAVAALMTHGTFWFWLVIFLWIVWLAAIASFVRSQRAAARRVIRDQD